MAGGAWLIPGAATFSGVWDGGSAVQPGGDFRGGGEMGKPPETWRFMLTPEEQADVESEPPVTVRDPEALARPAVQSGVYGELDHGGSSAAAAMCPWPALAAAYKLGGNMQDVGGKATTYGAGTLIATAPGYLVPGLQPAAAAGSVAGIFGIGAGKMLSGVGGTVQGLAGAGIGAQTGNWRPFGMEGALQRHVEKKWTQPG